MAKARAKFKTHLFTYLAVNALLWAIWLLTNANNGGTTWVVISASFPGRFGPRCSGALAC
ncbi:2TM domain-containing protein [Hymenobacter cellulosilyticus]|uniref:2TM domain-containing protein n=1 Tax=Hymenobacter cellulosilyticus TaxID=2932248 RepID=UPI0035C9AD04